MIKKCSVDCENRRCYLFYHELHVFKCFKLFLLKSHEKWLSKSFSSLLKREQKKKKPSRCYWQDGSGRSNTAYRILRHCQDDFRFLLIQRFRNENTKKHWSVKNQSYITSNINLNRITLSENNFWSMIQSWHMTRQPEREQVGRGLFKDETAAENNQGLSQTTSWAGNTPGQKSKVSERSGRIPFQNKTENVWWNKKALEQQTP